MTHTVVVRNGTRASLGKVYLFSVLTDNRKKQEHVCIVFTDA